MDNRHQSEREYIRYHAATSGEHLVAGIHGLAHGKSPAACCRRVALPPQSLREACSATRLPAGGRELTTVSSLAGIVVPVAIQALLFYSPYNCRHL